MKGNTLNTLKIYEHTFRENKSISFYLGDLIIEKNWLQNATLISEGVCFTGKALGSGKVDFLCKSMKPIFNYFSKLEGKPLQEKNCQKNLQLFGLCGRDTIDRFLCPLCYCYWQMCHHVSKLSFMPIGREANTPGQGSHPWRCSLSP